MFPFKRIAQDLKFIQITLDLMLKHKILTANL